MAKAKGGLGRGLGALLPEYEEIIDTHSNQGGIVELELEKIKDENGIPYKIRIAGIFEAADPADRGTGYPADSPQNHKRRSDRLFYISGSV